MPDAECCRMSQTVAKLAGTAATKTREVLQRSKQPPATNFNGLHRCEPDCHVGPPSSQPTPSMIARCRPWPIDPAGHGRPLSGR